MYGYDRELGMGDKGEEGIGRGKWQECGKVKWRQMADTKSSLLNYISSCGTGKRPVHTTIGLDFKGTCIRSERFRLYRCTQVKNRSTL